MAMLTSPSRTRGLSMLTMIAAFVLAGCSSTPEDAAPSSSDRRQAIPCGLGTGERATGTPIKLGALSIDSPGLVFTASTVAATAYFDCVNDNGGINGHPIDYVVYHDALDPAQSMSLAKQLIEEDEVTGMVASASVMDCIANNDIYAEEGFFVIGFAVPPQCFSVSNVSPINAGSLTAVPAAQLLVDAGATKIVNVINAAAGSGVIGESVMQYAESVGVAAVALSEPLPISDAAGLALRLAEEAGEGGGVVLNFTGDVAVQILSAAAQQGLENRVLWACAGTCVDDTLAEALGAAWNDNLLVASDFALPSSEGPDASLFRAVMDRYAPGERQEAVGIGGFTAALAAVDALLALPEQNLTVQGVNQAFRAITDFQSDLLCSPWSFGSASFHFSNSASRGVTPRDGVFVESAGCFDIAAVPANGLAELRASS